MWIIRFQKIKPSDYNYINRLLKKASFVPRKFSGIILVKATIIHILQKKSWRVLSNEMGINHIALFNFYDSFRKKEELVEIFHRFIDKRIVLFVGNEKLITRDHLDNSEDIIILTKQELKSKLS